MQTQKSKIVSLAIALFVMILPWPHLAEAQQGRKLPRIGYRGSQPAHSVIRAKHSGRRCEISAILRERTSMLSIVTLRDKQDKLPNLVAELVRTQGRCSSSSRLQRLSAAKQATKTIPIVMATTSDPVATG